MPQREIIDEINLTIKILKNVRFYLIIINYFCVFTSRVF